MVFDEVIKKYHIKKQLDGQLSVDKDLVKEFIKLLNISEIKKTDLSEEEKAELLAQPQSNSRKYKTKEVEETFKKIKTFNKINKISSVNKIDSKDGIIDFNYAAEHTTFNGDNVKYYINEKDEYNYYVVCYEAEMGPDLKIKQQLKRTVVSMLPFKRQQTDPFINQILEGSINVSPQVSQPAVEESVAQKARDIENGEG